ncbi:MAG: metallophosphoesterase [Anaerolineae bacterium]|nr:metallophosphoesterase [Anaerolineae bacterium]
MSVRKLRLLSLVLALASILVACSGAASEPSITPSVQPAVTSILPTATTVESTATPVPTSTVVPSTGDVGEEALAEPPSAGLVAESITTLMAHDVSLPFTFIAIGDTQDKNPKDTSGSEIFALLIQQINDLQPDFVIHLGDVSDRGTAYELDRFDGLITELEPPLVMVAGNHDTKSRRKLFGERYIAPNASTKLMDYSFDYGGVRFIIVDNSDYYLTREQLDWLERQLQTSKRKIVSMHCPPDYGRWKDMGGMYSPEAFMRLMKAHEVDLVYCGHIHLHNSMKVAGTKYIISGCGGGTLSGRDLGIKAHGFDVVRVDAESIHTEFVRLSVRRP